MKPSRHLPVRPDLEQLKREAEELSATEHVQLTDAQDALARSYGAPNWPRLVQSCQLIDAIWLDDLKAVRKLVTQHPNLLHENARIIKDNWGPPLTYAANLGHNEMIRMLYDLGARDLQTAMDRALLQSKIETARMLHEMMGSPPPPDGVLGGTAYTLSATGTQLALELGSRVVDENGNRIAPVDIVLETDSRKPHAKHRILELYVEYGLTLPDTPVMALHRGRIDLLEDHLRRDPELLKRTFTHEEIYPPELGCHDEVLATQGTPLKGTTLLHLCADYDELEIAEWLLAQGMDPNVRAAVDNDGFGGHTALFGTVVSQQNFWMNYGNRGPFDAPFTELLLQHGADPTIRASLRKKLHDGYAPKYDTENTYEYHDVTALEWGREFHAKVFVSEPAIKLIEERLAAKIM
jgi:ankyrin repeat protein